MQGLLVTGGGFWVSSKDVNVATDPKYVALSV
jgi:hypothetical protein